jgi:hypothetical protein
MKTNKVIFNYRTSCDKLVVKWLEDYFDAEWFDYYWINFGDIFQFADYYVNVSTILECYEHNISKEQFFLWYDSSLAQQTTTSLSDFILFPAKREEARKKHLEERLETAEKELKRALDEYKCFYNPGMDTSGR